MLVVLQGVLRVVKYGRFHGISSWCCARGIRDSMESRWLRVRLPGKIECEGRKVVYLSLKTENRFRKKTGINNKLQRNYRQLLSCHIFTAAKGIPFHAAAISLRARFLSLSIYTEACSSVRRGHQWFPTISLQVAPFKEAYKTSKDLSQREKVVSPPRILLLPGKLLAKSNSSCSCFTN